MQAAPAWTTASPHGLVHTKQFTQPLGAELTGRDPKRLLYCKGTLPVADAFNASKTRVDVKPVARVCTDPSGVVLPVTTPVRGDTCCSCRPGFRALRRLPAGLGTAAAAAGLPAARLVVVEEGFAAGAVAPGAVVGAPPSAAAADGLAAGVVVAAAGAATAALVAASEMILLFGGALVGFPGTPVGVAVTSGWSTWLIAWMMLLPA